MLSMCSSERGANDANEPIMYAHHDGIDIVSVPDPPPACEGLVPDINLPYYTTEMRGDIP